MHIPLAPPTPFDFDAFRRMRFADGLVCPHCDSRRVNRWGRFSGRRRYRCKGCRRTFSDFTATPLAFLKHLDRWDGFCDCVRTSRSLRWAGARLGLHVSTTFRWRHRVLAELCHAEGPTLGGTVALQELTFPFSAKGTRRLDRPPRHRGHHRPWELPPVWVLLARDDHDRAYGRVTGAERPREPDLTRVLLPRVEPGATLADTAGPYGAAARLARVHGFGYQRRGFVDGPGGRIHPVLETRRALIVWLERFRGVATRYLDHYIAWFEYLHHQWTRPRSDGSPGAVRPADSRGDQGVSSAERSSLEPE